MPCSTLPGTDAGCGQAFRISHEQNKSLHERRGEFLHYSLFVPLCDHYLVNNGVSVLMVKGVLLLNMEVLFAVLITFHGPSFHQFADPSMSRKLCSMPFQDALLRINSVGAMNMTGTLVYH